MKVLKFAIFGFLTLVGFVALGQSIKMTREQYIQTYKSVAIECQEVYGIPASIKLAQGLLESDNGNSRLAIEANNHFGIKCKKEWTGETISHDDDAKGECFRKYATALDSYNDHSEFLDKSPRYQSLFALEPTDYKGWAQGLKDAGYATNPNYPQMLVKIIEDNKLYLFDTMGEQAPAVEAEPIVVIVPDQGVEGHEKIDMDNFVVSLYSQFGYPVYRNNGSEYVYAKAGDSYSSIAMSFGISLKRLCKFNDVSAGAKLNAGEIVYIKSKSRRASHTVTHKSVAGETLHSISQRYGVRLRYIESKNQRLKGSNIAVGTEVWLR